MRQSLALAGLVVMGGYACSSDGLAPNGSGSRAPSLAMPVAAATAGAPTAGAAPEPGSATGTDPVGSGTGKCAEAVAAVTAVTPTVWLVVDGSNSMDEPFSGTDSRWSALRSTLVGPTGVVPTLQANVRFGMVIYAGSQSGTECVTLQTVDAALNNFAAIEAAYPMMPVAGGTPTDKALDHVFMKLAMLDRPPAELLANPVYVVLATDGEPNDFCAGNGGGRGGGRGSNAAVQQRVVDITKAGSERGANVYIISLAGGDAQLQSHLEQVAGVTVSRQPPYSPATQAELVSAIGSVVSTGTCQILLNGMVRPGLECMGQVLLNGQPLTCNDPNGWRLTGPSTFQLVGTACDAFLSMQLPLQAAFPCEVFIPD
jgi:hypothetical protein